MSTGLSQDPQIKQLISRARASTLSRRAFLSGIGLGAAGFALSACASGVSSPGAASDASQADQSLTWDNWRDYIDLRVDRRSETLGEFTRRTGITVAYRESIEGNESYYANIKRNLQNGEATGADTFCLTEWMVARLIKFGYIQELDGANIPNKKNLAPALADPDFDPGRAHSMPWQSGFAGLAWNSEEVPNGLRTVSGLWDVGLRGRVSVLREFRDTIGLIMLEQGVDISGPDWGQAEFGAAVGRLDEQLKPGQIVTVSSDTYVDDMFSGKVVAGMAYSGDIVQLNERVGYEKFKFAIPESGSTLYGDSFVVPLGSTHKANVEKLIDYYYEPEVAAAVAAACKRVTPVVGAREVAAKKYPQYAFNPLVFPDETVLKTTHVFRSLGANDYQTYYPEFEKIIAPFV